MGYELAEQNNYMQDNNFRTDLARELIRDVEVQDGISQSIENLENDVEIHTVEISSPLAVKVAGKPMGKYVTIEAKEILTRDLETQKFVAVELSKQIKAMLKDVENEEGTVLVVGIGNRGMTADALGSKVCDDIISTRHIISMLPTIDKSLNSMCAIAPGVMGETGIEVFDIVKGICEKIKPKAVICVDSLASQSLHRLATTFQVSSSGIVPGGGIANARKAFSKETLGVDVVAVGVPLVVYATTIAKEFLFGNENQVSMNQIENIAALKKSSLGDLVVTPKDIDVLVSDDAFIISTAINLAIHKGLTVDDVISYMH